MKSFLRIIALGLLVSMLSMIIGIYWEPLTAEARTWPDDVNQWTEEDWREFNNYYNAYYYRTQQTQGPVWYNGHYCYWNGSYWYYIAEDGCAYYADLPQNYYYSNANTQPINNNIGYGNYNYYGGVLNVYDAASEGQAQILAKIIYLYGHGVASQTQQACVGWAVMNSIDASSAGVDIGAIAPNFHYDSNKPTVDDFGRDLMPLARDIIFRWKAGRAGITSNGRVMPSEYCWVWSTGTTVLFRSTPNESGAPWTYSYSTPYGS